MLRLNVIAVIFAVGTMSLATPQANAQSPDPAMLAPGQFGADAATTTTPGHDRATRP
jgi:hypothetical protein